MLQRELNFVRVYKFCLLLTLETHQDTEWATWRVSLTFRHVVHTAAPVLYRKNTEMTSTAEFLTRGLDPKRWRLERITATRTHNSVSLPFSSSLLLYSQEIKFYAHFLTHQCWPTYGPVKPQILPASVHRTAVSAFKGPKHLNPPPPSQATAGT
jgi:hypothetical protein